MDIGVGSFLFAQALTSKQARGSSHKGSRMSTIMSTIKAVSPLLVIGFVRLASVKGTDYQEHVTEYGVHWNFFFTLAFVSLLVGIVNVSSDKLSLAGLFIIFVYQLCLSKFGLAEYIIHHSRDNLFSQNREGILSIFGYAALFCVGAHLGNFILKPRPSMREWHTLFFQLLLLNAIAYALTLFSNEYIAPISRRMLNISYFFSVITLNIFTITMQLLVGIITPPKDNLILTAVNYNGLAMFLLANLGTGLVNLSMKTIYASDGVAFFILSVYIGAISVVSVILHQWKIQLKFW
eukprot:TRINITY_DN5242_c0_g1_i2.p1 TRINITY_DN5242_c0_g1~~TRINITY_DN5242_c0_g1_i2.p1  ORF type:complete len:293 (+),score=44.52 TRINITY_DN5242_c0_g1_i2:501-1379(+)